MHDAWHFWGGDLAVSSSGDIYVADQMTTGEQRVLRRLLTNQQLKDSSNQPQASADYIFHPTYGAGLPRMVGMPVDIAATNAVIVAQMAKEQAVARLPLPVIQVTPFSNGNGLNANIAYNDASSLTPVILDFDVNR
jgi:hypothetical protein